jgi:molybdate transport system regulatory protein
MGCVIVPVYDIQIPADERETYSLTTVIPLRILRAMKMSREQPPSKPHFRPGQSDTLPADVCVQSDSLSFKVRMWLEKENETYLSYARITLLERIRDYGSITKAARSMSISYRHAWKLVDSMNRLATQPLVTTASGGRGGGGALVTETGEKAIQMFHQINKKLKRFIQSMQVKVSGM